MDQVFSDQLDKGHHVSDEEWSNCPCCGLETMHYFECPSCFREVCPDCIGDDRCRRCKKRNPIS